ncbi:unnamed protein product [Aphanomyces euteiches]
MITGLLRRTIARRGAACYSMDAFLEFERELARKKRAEKPPQPPRIPRLEPPREPLPDECCNLNCPNCVLLVYNEQLLEYEDSIRWAAHTEGSTPPPPFVEEIEITFAPEDFTIDVPAMPEGVSKFFVSASRVLSHTNERSVYHIQFDISPRNSFETAANLTVHMPNADSLVERCLARLDSANGASLFKVNYPTKYHQEWTTLATLLKWSVDLASPPSPRILRLLSTHTSDSADREILLEAADMINTLTLVDVLEMHPSIRLSVPSFLSIAPSLTARNYTIASSPLQDPSTVALAVAAKPNGRCSVFLGTKSPGDEIHAAIAPSSFSQVWTKLFTLPSLNAPWLCIATGTGIAPFRGMLQDLKQRPNRPKDVALYNGCRAPDVDWLYHDEIESAVKDGLLKDYRPAFSQHNSKKQYVQDLLLQDAASVCEYVVEQRGYVFVCGSLAMGRDVKRTLVECMEQHLGWSTEDAKAYVNTMQVEKRYVAEVW